MTWHALVRLLHDAAERLPFAEAAWIGGGAAFDRIDRYSDVDLQIVCDAEHADAAFDAIERALPPIALTLHTTGPLRQRFYRLAEGDPHLFVDFCVIPRAELAPYLDPIRHGRPRVLFDRTGVLDPEPNVPDLDERLRRAVARFRFFSRVLVERTVGRGKTVEAVWAWQGFVINPLVEVLRALHSPARQDFGLRYTDIDLPADVYRELAAMITFDVARSDALLTSAESLFDRTVDRLVAAGRLPGDGRSGVWTGP